MAHLLDAIDENRSLWVLGKPPYQATPPLTADAKADVAIIGGGFTGVSTAWHLTERFPDKRIVLCEARELANGASGRNGGLMLNWINGVHSPDAEHASRIFALTKDGIDRMVALIAREKLDVAHRRDGSLEVFTDARRAEEAQRRVEELRPLGVPLEYIEGAALERRMALSGAAGAILDPTTGHIDGVDFLRAMRARLLERGVEIYENTPVLRVEEGKDIRLVTPSAEIVAKAVVLATNAYTRELGYFKDTLFPLHSHVVATEAASRERWREIGWAEHAGFSDDLDRVAYGCMTTRGEMVFGGGSNSAYTYRFGGGTVMPRAPGRGFAAIERRLRSYLPGSESLAIAHRWSGPVALTMSRCFAVGVRGEHKNVYYAFGYSGHGVVLANVAGAVIADMFADDADRWRDYPFFQPRLWPIPPEPLRWMGYHVYTKLTGRSPRRPH